jgi:hypothetical protein
MHKKVSLLGGSQVHAWFQSLIKTGQLKIYVDSMVRQILLQQFCHDIASAALSQRTPCAETSTPFCVSLGAHVPY